MILMLITEAPMSCEECPCADNCTDSIYCQADAYNFGNRTKRPDWCPLRPLPMYRHSTVDWYLKPVTCASSGADIKSYEPSEYDMGWNDCIDFIKGELDV